MERPGFNTINTLRAPDGKPTGYPTLEAPDLVARWNGRAPQSIDTNVWQVLAAGESTEASRALNGEVEGRYKAAPASQLPPENIPPLGQFLLELLTPSLIPSSALNHPTSKRNLKAFKVNLGKK